MKFLRSITLLFFTILFFSLEVYAQNDQLYDGSLIRGSKNNIFVYMNGKAVWIPNEKIFNMLNLDWNSVIKIQDEKLKEISRGWLFLSGGDQSVYIYSYGKIRKIINMKLFDGLGFNRREILIAPEDKLKSISEGPLLVKGSGDFVYLIVNEKACWIESDKIFNMLGFDSKTVVRIGDYNLDKLPKAPLLIRGTEEKIYKIENNQRMWISNPDIFDRLGYDWNTIYYVDDNILNNIPEGSPIR